MAPLQPSPGIAGGYKKTISIPKQLRHIVVLLTTAGHGDVGKLSPKATVWGCGTEMRAPSIPVCRQGLYAMSPSPGQRKCTMSFTPVLRQGFCEGAPVATK